METALVQNKFRYLGWNLSEMSAESNPAFYQQHEQSLRQESHDLTFYCLHFT
jgi:hypothetical protein